MRQPQAQSALWQSIPADWQANLFPVLALVRVAELALELRAALSEPESLPPAARLLRWAALQQLVALHRLLVAALLVVAWLAGEFLAVLVKPGSVLVPLVA